jgi:hypothetical protein
VSSSFARSGSLWAAKRVEEIAVGPDWILKPASAHSKGLLEMPALRLAVSVGPADQTVVSTF